MAKVCLITSNYGPAQLPGLSLYIRVIYKKHFYKKLEAKIREKVGNI